MGQTRKQYIESEFKKWNEKYEIGFEQEFDVKALLGLQYQFMTTSPEHIKSLGDIVHTMNQIKKELNLKENPLTKKNGERYKIAIYSENNFKKNEIGDLIEKLFKNKIRSLKRSHARAEIYTNDFEIRISSKSDPSERGIRSDVVINLDSELHITY